MCVLTEYTLHMSQMRPSCKWCHQNLRWAWNTHNVHVQSRIWGIFVSTHCASPIVPIIQFIRNHEIIFLCIYIKSPSFVFIWNHLPLCLYEIIFLCSNTWDGVQSILIRKVRKPTSELETSCNWKLCNDFTPFQHFRIQNLLAHVNVVEQNHSLTQFDLLVKFWKLNQSLFVPLRGIHKSELWIAESFRHHN